MVVAVEAPGICLPLRGDGDVVVGARGSVDAPGYGKRGWLEENAWSSTLDDDLVWVIQGKFAYIEAHLCAVDATPDETFTAPSDPDGMMRSATDHLHVLPDEGLDLPRGDDTAAVFAGAGGDPCLREVVRAPGPGVAVGVDGEGVVGASVDGDNLSGLLG